MKRPDDLMLRAMEQAAQLTVAEVPMPDGTPEPVTIRDLLSAAELERVVGVVRRVFAAPVLVLHPRIRESAGTGVTRDYCAICTDGCTDPGPVLWPCPTVRALGDLGEDAP